MSTDNTSPFAIQNIISEDFVALRSATVTPSNTILYPVEELSTDAIVIKEEIMSSIRVISHTGETRTGELGHLQRRLTKFSKSASIKVGGVTEADKLERKDRIDDATSALYAAIKGGVVPGGGYMLLNAAKATECSSIMRAVCYEPALKLHPTKSQAELESILVNDNTIDSYTGEQGLAKFLGILDPADVQIKSLQQALAITKTLVNTNTILISIEDGEA